MLRRCPLSFPLFAGLNTTCERGKTCPDVPPTCKWGPHNPRIYVDDVCKHSVGTSLPFIFPFLFSYFHHAPMHSNTARTWEGVSPGLSTSKRGLTREPPLQNWFRNSCPTCLPSLIFYILF